MNDDFKNVPAETAARPRKVNPETVEILGADEPIHPKNPFAANSEFVFKNMKVIRSGPLVFLLPILIPLFLVIMLVMAIPLLIFGRFFGRAIIKNIRT